MATPQNLAKTCILPIALLALAAFLGGPGRAGADAEAGGEIMTALAVDSTGASYVGGRTNSSAYPTRKAAQKRKRGAVDGCLTHIKK